MKLKSTLKAIAKAIISAVMMAGPCPANAAEPLCWERTPNRPAPAQFDTFHGESLDFRCTFTGFGALPFPGGAISESVASAPRLYYQTNGMGSAWWSLPATVSSNMLAATFPPSADPGAERLTVFFGAPSNAYAAAQVRFRNSPGANPNDLDPPSVLDWQAELFSATNALAVSISSQMSQMSQSATNYTDLATNSLAKSLATTISNTVTKAYVESLGIESGISASTATNIAFAVSADATNSLAKSLAPTISAATNALTRQEAEAGFTEWIVSGLVEGESVYSPPSFVPGSTRQWSLRIIDSKGPGSIYMTLSDDGKNATNLVFNGDRITATRTRLPTMADIPTKTSDLVNDGSDGEHPFISQDEVQHQHLTPVYSQTPTFTEWTCDPAEYQGHQIEFSLLYDEGMWFGVIKAGDVENRFPFTQDEATGLVIAGGVDWSGDVDVTATRVRTDIIGYTLGDQTNSVLAATNVILTAETATNIVKSFTTNLVQTTNSPSGAVAYTFGTRSYDPVYTNVGPYSVTMGTSNSASAVRSIAMGEESHSRGVASIAAGTKSTANHGRSYSWNGDTSARYFSKGTGAYCINPQNGIYGFYIGDQNLYQVLISTLSSTNSNEVTFIDEDENTESTQTFPPLPVLRQSDISPLQNSVNAMWATMYGESVWIAVTNYMRQIAGTVPSLRLWEVRDNTTNLVYSSAEEIEHITTQKVNAAKSEINGIIPRTAWGSYQSSGEDNPSSNAVTVVNSEKVMLTGGGKWYKAIETGGRSLWVLHFSGLQTVGGDTNGFFRVCDAKGNAQLEVVKTADQIVSAIPSYTTFVDGDFTVTFNAGGSTHPKASCALELGDDFETEDGSGNINSLGISVEWNKNADNLWVATIHQDNPATRLFVYANALQQGENLVRNNAPTSLEGGIYINNVKYRLVPYATGGKTYLTLEAYQ